MHRLDMVSPPEIAEAARGGSLNAPLVKLEDIADFQKASFRNESAVSNILGKDFEVVDANALAPNDSTADSGIPPGDRFLAIAENITSPEDYVEKRDDMMDIIDEQKSITNKALTAFEEHPAIKTLLPQTKKEYDDVIASLPEELRKDSDFMKTLYNLPSAVYSNNPQSGNMFDYLISRLGTDRAAQDTLVLFADKILKTAQADPELVGEYTEANNAYIAEANTEIAMYKVLFACDEIFKY